MPRSTTGACAPLLVGALLSATSPTASAQPPARVTGTAELTAVALPPLIGAPSHFVGQGDRLIVVDYSDMSVHWADAEGRWLGALRRVSHCDGAEGVRGGRSRHRRHPARHSGQSGSARP